MTKCEHSLRRIYYRKKEKNKKQSWLVITNKYYCEKCKKVLEIK